MDNNEPKKKPAKKVVTPECIENSFREFLKIKKYINTIHGVLK